MENKDNNK